MRDFCTLSSTSCQHFFPSNPIYLLHQKIDVAIFVGSYREIGRQVFARGSHKVGVESLRKTSSLDLKLSGLVPTEPYRHRTKFVFSTKNSIKNDRLDVVSKIDFPQFSDFTDMPIAYVLVILYVMLTDCSRPLFYEFPA